MSGGTILDNIHMQLRNHSSGSVIDIWIDVYNSSLGQRWIQALNVVLANNFVLEKNFCFLGFAQSDRSGPFILDQINHSIDAINHANIGYHIQDHFDMSNSITDEDIDNRAAGRNLVHDKFNQLHRYFEDLQGVSGAMSPFYLKADVETQWHIRQLNLLCHEFESWALSYRKEIEAPEWTRPSQLMCWLNAPRFELEPEDYELFGIETINRKLGGVYVGVNKAVGKHHWEVFNDEGRDSRLEELVSTTLRGQTQAAADFDIEWGRDPGGFEWQIQRLQQFREWLTVNGFDPNDPALTIGHPQVGQVDLVRSFGTDDPAVIWEQLNTHLDVVFIATSSQRQTYNYHWSDSDFVTRQLSALRKESQ